MLINCDCDLSTFLKGMLPLFPSILKVLFIFIQWNIFISACSYDLFFCFKLFEYFLIVGDMFSDEAFVIPFNSSWEKDV